MKHFLRLMTLGFGLFTLLCGPLSLRPAAAERSMALLKSGQCPARASTTSATVLLTSAAGPKLKASLSRGRPGREFPANRRAPSHK